MSNIREKSGKSQGILKWMVSGNPAYSKEANKNSCEILKYCFRKRGRGVHQSRGIYKDY